MQSLLHRYRAGKLQKAVIINERTPANSREVPLFSAYTEDDGQIIVFPSVRLISKDLTFTQDYATYHQIHIHRDIPSGVDMCAAYDHHPPLRHLSIELLFNRISSLLLWPPSNQ
jgi:hypothetical protein